MQNMPYFQNVVILRSLACPLHNKKKKEELRMFSTKFFKKAVIAGLAAALFCAPAQSFAKETVKVGFIGPLTGGLSALGVGGRNSADLAVQEANEDPNSKFLYELTSFDDECKPNVGIQVATKAASDRKMVGAVTHYCSAVALGTVGIYHRFKMPAIVWGAVQPDITYGNDYKEIFRTPGTMINQNEQAAKFMYGKGYRTVAIIHDITDYGNSHAEFFTKFFEKLGGKVVGSFGVNSDQQDFTAELTKVKALKPDVLYVGALVPVGVRVRSQMAKLDLPCQFEGCSGIKSDAFITGVGADVAEGTLSFIEGTPIDKLAGGANFLAEYTKHGYKEPAEAYGPFSYVAMQQLIQAVEHVGPDRVKIAEYLSKIKGADTLVGKVTYDDHGQNIEPAVSCFVAQDGKWIYWPESEYASGKRQLKAPASK